MEEEAEPPEDWQREVEEDIEEEKVFIQPQVEEEMKKRGDNMALPFLMGVSPAGFLSATRKQPGGTDHLVQVRPPPYMVMTRGVMVQASAHAVIR